MLSFTNAIAVAGGAIPGALCRYYFTLWSKQGWGGQFPYGTFLINITGCFMIGFFVMIIASFDSVPGALRLSVATGFLGSYTTFSTYEYDAYLLWQSADRGATVLYWLGSVVYGAIALWLGVQCAYLFI
jgi:fluoride exporter